MCLAAFSTNHGLDRDARQALGAAYVGQVRAADERALELRLFIADFGDALWAVARGATSGLGLAPDAEEHVERLEASAASPAFVSALGDQRLSPRIDLGAAGEARARRPEDDGQRGGLGSDAHDSHDLEYVESPPHETRYRPGEVAS